MHQFDTTCWTILLKAKDSNSKEAERAYRHLCEAYWSPLYMFARRKGCSLEDAGDLVQEFLARIWEKKRLQNVDRDRGKFRTYLLKGLDNLLKDEWARRNAIKRRPPGQLVSLDTNKAEEHYRSHDGNTLTPEEVFDREWAVSIMRLAVDRIRTDYERTGKSQLFDSLAPYLSYEVSQPTYVELGRSMGRDPNTVKSAVRRLRLKYREELRRCVADTVSDHEAFEEEANYLLQVFAPSRPRG